MSDFSRDYWGNPAMYYISKLREAKNGEKAELLYPSTPSHIVIRHHQLFLAHKPFANCLATTHLVSSLPTHLSAIRTIYSVFYPE